MIELFLQTYSSIFDIEMWKQFFSSQEAIGLIVSLIILEGLLSADNTLVLAIMVRSLPENQQRKALFYGLFGAYFFRFIAVGIGLFLVKFWYIKLLGAIYLLFIAFNFFKKKFFKQKEKNNTNVFEKFRNKLVSIIGVFWATVASIELMDIAFSIDSILAAIALVAESSKETLQLPALLIGGFLGIIMMRTIAGLFLKLLKKIPELEVTAHILILLIGLKMLLSVIDIHISHNLFFIFIILLFLITFLINYLRNKKTS